VNPVAPTSIALFPLNVVLFPDGPLPLRIFETRYVDMVRRCMRGEQHFGVALIREGKEAGRAETFDVGTMAKIVDFHQLSDGFLGLSCIGQQRFRIHSRTVQADGLNLAEIEYFGAEPKIALPERHARLAELLQSVLPQLDEVYKGIAMQLGDAGWIGYRLAEILPIAAAEKQFCLELEDPIQRLDALSPLALALGTST
jgi:Lon protease-like protein